MADCNKCASADSCERVWKGINNPMRVGFEPSRTNADRIRAMSDDELADFIHMIFMRGYSGAFPAEWIGWLQQEAKDEV